MKLVQLLDNIDFNHVMIFVNSARRAETLYQLLHEEEFPVTFSHGGLETDKRYYRIYIALID